jgi:hypothetical protein
MKGRLAVMTKFSADFDIREYTVPRSSRTPPGRITRGGICGSDLHICAASCRPDRSRPRPDVRSRDVRGDRAAREERLEGLDGRSAGATGSPTATLPVRPLPCLPPRPPGGLPEQAARTRRGRPAHFVGSCGEYFYLRPGHFV